MLKKCSSYIKSTLQVAIFFVWLGLSVIVQAQEARLVLSVEDVNALIPEIEAAEKRLLNLKVESKVWVEEKSVPSEPWVRTPIYVSSTAWFDGNPKGKARVDVHKQVTKWVDGPAPYGESSYSVSFDGQYGRVVRYSTGHSGKTHLSKRGELLSDAPVRLRTNNAYTGAKFSLYFFFADEDEGRTFSQFFRVAISPAALEAKAFEVALEEFQGVECIKFSSGEQPWGHATWWLDPSRGFALLGYEHINIRRDGSEWLISRMKVNKLKEVAPRIWWPMEASAESGPSRPGKPYSRTVYRASNVVANDPNFDESIFTVPLPDGYLIDDQVAGRKYRVGEEPNIPKK